MYPVLLEPVAKNYMWGGARLAAEFGVTSASTKIAEAWLLSCHEAGPSILRDGPMAGHTLSESIYGELESVLGTDASVTDQFPILIKLIDAHEDLSIQVHPDDAYALIHGLGCGKTELWYILDATPDAFIYYGFTRPVSPEELREHIDNHTVEEIIRRVPVKKGDAFLIKSGVIHGIGAGILLAEIQQNSNTTFRVYDFDRRDADGTPRELHVEKALDVIRLDFTTDGPLPESTEVFENYTSRRLSTCRYFSVDCLEISGEAALHCDAASFHSIVVTNGDCEMVLQHPDPLVPAFRHLHKGDSVFLPANTGDYTLRGTAEVLITSV